MKKYISLLIFAVAAVAFGQPNILFVTVDDMSCDSVGVYGCKVPGTSPNMDKLAAESLRFEHAHVVVGNCKPSRNVMWSGRYPHNNRVEGFYDVKDPDYPVLCDLMQANGYFAGIRGKVSHSTPYSPYAWDAILGEDEHMKDADSYYRSTKEGIALAKAAKKPFCLLINISDPHKPFWSVTKNGTPDTFVPSRIYTAEEMVVPGFLPDHPDVRSELALYYSSVRRADDCLGRALAALDESGEAENTVVMFLSDHGMPLPFAKTAVWHHSTRTPYMVRWPGVTQAGAVDDEHMVSAVDLLPTLLDITGIAHPEGLDGRSMVSLLKGEKQADRDMIVKEYNENAGGNRNPMRSIQTKRFCYIFNPWVDGKRVFKTATTGTASYRAMQALAPADASVARRLDLFNHRVWEELYDVKNDPDALTNLIENPEYAKELKRLHEGLEAWMEKTDDHLLEVFQQREDEAIAEAYMTRVEAEAAARRKKPKRTQKKMKLFTLELPESARAGEAVRLRIPHTLPKKLATQKIHVTLKGPKGMRIDRKVLAIRGKGELEVKFLVPADTVKGIHFAAFVGEDHPSNLQHENSSMIPLE